MSQCPTTSPLIRARFREGLAQNHGESAERFTIDLQSDVEDLQKWIETRSSSATPSRDKLERHDLRRDEQLSFSLENALHDWSSIRSFSEDFFSYSKRLQSYMCSVTLGWGEKKPAVGLSFLHDSCVRVPASRGYSE